MTNVVEIKDVSKRFVVHKDKSLKERIVNARASRQHREAFWALRDVSFNIQIGDTVGLVGANGSGKSTLLKIIGGILTPDDGTVMLRGRIAALLELGAGFHPDLTGRENVFLNASILGLSEKETASKLDEIVDFSGIESFLDTQVKFYSSGMYVRLAFAVAVHVDPDILLVDEVLAVGDEAFQHKCMEKVREFQKEGRTIILVSHSAMQVQEVCNRAIMLEKGRVVADGSTSEVLGRLHHEYEERIEADELANAEKNGEPTSLVQIDQKITRVELVGLSEQPGVSWGPVLSSGSDLVIHGSIEATPALAGWDIGVNISNSFGGVVVGTDTRMLGIRLSELGGTGAFEIRIPNLKLGAGDYSVTVALLDGNYADICRIRDAARFTVRTDGKSVGAISIDTTIQLL